MCPVNYWRVVSGTSFGRAYASSPAPISRCMAVCTKYTFGTSRASGKPMTAIHETAYPRMRSNLSDQELEELYPPSPDDLAFIHRATQSPVAAFGGVVLLKTFQRLGYFPHFDGLPPRLIHHLATVLGVLLPHEALQHYEQRRLREWHIPQIRAHCGITAFSDGGRWKRPFTCPILSACGTSRLVPAWPRPHRLDSGR